MSYKILIVDDSRFFQQRLQEIIDDHKELTVVGIASNGQEAIDMARRLRPDVISMDYEMPCLDGVAAVRAIMADRPVPIVMFSSLTYKGARVTLAALEAGAVDFLPKNFADISRRSGFAKHQLQESLLFYAKNAHAKVPGYGRGLDDCRADAQGNWRPDAGGSGKVKILIIGASTGGPVAVTDLLMQLPGNFPVPVIVVQHMPADFTRVFAERLDLQCALEVREARNGDRLAPGLVLVAPGAQQLIFEPLNRDRIKIKPGDERMNYKPSLDITFASAANLFNKHVLGVVLTGMGRDGCEGARLLKANGACIWVQDEGSCVVYGMPKAIASAGLADEQLPLSLIGPRLATELVARPETDAGLHC